LGQLVVLAILICLLGLVVLFIRLKAFLESRLKQDWIYLPLAPRWRARTRERLAWAEAAIAVKTKKKQGPAASFTGSHARLPEPEIGAQGFCAGVLHFNRAR